MLIRPWLHFFHFLLAKHWRMGGQCQERQSYYCSDIFIFPISGDLHSHDFSLKNAMENV